MTNEGMENRIKNDEQEEAASYVETDVDKIYQRVHFLSQVRDITRNEA